MGVKVGEYGFEWPKLLTVRYVVRLLSARILIATGSGLGTRFGDDEWTHRSRALGMLFSANSKT